MDAITKNAPVEALETNRVTYGIPYPYNIQIARDFE